MSLDARGDEHELTSRPLAIYGPIAAIYGPSSLATDLLFSAFLRAWLYVRAATFIDLIRADEGRCPEARSVH